MKLGIIGQSPGNGHPYSWSAILNGFKKKYLENVPYPLIKKYLTNIDPMKKLFNDVSIKKIFCSDYEYASNVAKFANIEKVARDLDQFGKDLDGIILARDDYQNHYKILKYLVDYNIPILIDKPIATEVTELKKILNVRKFDNQFFSCSGLYFSPEIKLFPKQIDKLKKITAYTNGPWDRYAIHLINILECYFKELLVDFHNFKSLKKENENSLIINFQTFDTEIIVNSNKFNGVVINFEFEKNCKKIVFKKTYEAFSSLLIAFIGQIKTKEACFNDDDYFKTVRLIEYGKI